LQYKIVGSNVTPPPIVYLESDPSRRTIDGTQRTANLMLRKLSDLGFTDPTGGNVTQAVEVEFVVKDRAGNTRSQTVKGMALKFPALTEESIFLSDLYMPSLPDDRMFLNPNDPNNPNNPGDNGGGLLYVGPGGAWGYGTRSGGGSGAWNWNNNNNPGGNGDPQIPQRIIDPEALLDYLPALKVMLTTARDVLSNHPSTGAKKEVLRRQLDMLMAVGEVVDANGFYEAMRPMLKSVFTNAYGPGGKLTRRQAILNGWAFAKAIALEPKMTSLQVFEAQLYATGLAALKQTGNSLATIPTNLEGIVKSLATNYARLRPTESTGINWVYNDFMGILFNNSQRVSSLGSQAVSQARSMVSLAISDLAKQFQGQVDPLGSLNFMNRMLMAATNVKQLHEDGYTRWRAAGGNSYLGTINPSSIRKIGFLDQLSDLAFTIARVNPTISTPGVRNDVSEWIETLWEGGSPEWAAGGLAQIFEGFRIAKPVFTNFNVEIEYGNQMEALREQTMQTLDYLGRLVRAADAVDDVRLDKDVLKADFLSRLLMFGRSYFSLNPGYDTSSSTTNFAGTLLRFGDIVKASNELENFLLEVSSPTERMKLLTYQHNLLRVVQYGMKERGITSIKTSNLAGLIDWGTKYLLSQSSQNADLIVNPMKGFFASVAYETTPKTIVATTTSSTIPTTLSFGSPYLVGQFLGDPANWNLFFNGDRNWLRTLLDLLQSPQTDFDRLVKYVKIKSIENVTRVVPSLGGSIYDEATSEIVQRRIIAILDELYIQGADSKSSIAAVLAVAAHESTRFRKLLEEDPGIQYEGRIDLMNDVEGDGPRYRGRGFVQLTGKIRYADYFNRAKNDEFSNYEFVRYRQFNPSDLGLLLLKPELVSENEYIAAFTLVDYFVNGRATTMSGFNWEYGDGTPRPQGGQFPSLRTTSDPRGYKTFVTDPQTILPFVSGKTTNSTIEEIAGLVNQYTPTAFAEILDFYQKYLEALNS
jgi:hypothetical protein